MNRFISLLVLSVGLLVASACATASPTSTPSPAKEWDMEDIQVVGSTVTVPLRVYAGIDVWVTLDGRRADDIVSPRGPTSATLMYIFRNVALGKHTVEVQDVIGYHQTAEVVVSTSTAPPTPTSIPTPENPVWLRDLSQRLENEPVANPPAFIARYEYKGRTVYFLPQRCCDIFSNLYDDEGNIIGHPDGGITGQGDGRVPDFFETRTDETIVWSDQRAYDSELVQVLAPIESVDVLIMEIFPVQYSLAVVSGLPNACVSYGGYTVTRNGNTIRVETFNWKPADSQVACAQVYTTVSTVIPLGSEFESGKTYTVVAGNVTEAFVAQ